MYINHEMFSSFHAFPPLKFSASVNYTVGVTVWMIMSSDTDVMFICG